MNPVAPARAYSKPIPAGVVLGLLLFAVILLAGRGLGASGAFASSAAATVHAVAPRVAQAQPYIASYVPAERGGLLGEWLVIELLGVAAGAWISARLAGRLHRGIETVAAEGSRARLAQALGGGFMMGAGARLAHGCTSGLALTGGALLDTGAWLFIPVTFATAFAVAFLMHRGAVGSQ